MITKSEATKVLGDEHKSQMAALEAAIDGALHGYDDGDSVTVDLGGRGYPRKVIAAVADRYRLEGGWDVIVVAGDYRGPGPFMKFS